MGRHGRAAYQWIRVLGTGDVSRSSTPTVWVDPAGPGSGSRCSTTTAAAAEHIHEDLCVVVAWGPMDIVPLARFRCTSMLWQPTAGSWTLTIVCKATYRLAPEVSPFH